MKGRHENILHIIGDLFLQKGDKWALEDFYPKQFSKVVARIETNISACKRSMPQGAPTFNHDQD